MNSVKAKAVGFVVTVAALFVGVISANAANPFVFSQGAVSHPNGIVATPDVFLVSSQDQHFNGSTWDSLIYSLDAAGAVIPGSGFNGAWVTITDATNQASNVQEVYLAAAPGVGGGWTAFDIYACRGNKVYQIPAAGGSVDGTAPFATLTGATDRQHCGITFDRVGTFGFDMIVTTQGDGLGGSVGGGIYRITTAGGAVAAFKVLDYSNANETANVTEGPAVAPNGFFGASGELLLTQEDNPSPAGGTVLHVSNGGAAAAYTTAIGEPESVHIVPPAVCDYTTTGGGFFTTDFFNNSIIAYPATDFVGLHGDALIPIEFTSAGNNIKDINHTTGVVGDFDTVSNGIVHEGSTFVECGPATMPIIKHSTGVEQPTDADFLFGLYPRGDSSFTNPPANYVVNTDGSVTGACAAVPFYTGPDLRGTCIVTPPENNLPIDVSQNPFFASVCELKHTAGWTFDSWTVQFTGAPTDGGTNHASAPYSVTGETGDTEIRCIDLEIHPGTTEVQLDVYDTPPPTGGEYCSPGYWKQPQHFGNYPANIDPWGGDGTPETLFTSIFTVGSVHTYDGLGFPEVISLGGGGYNMLGRVCAASYLDSAKLNFGMPTANVVSLCNAAFAANDTKSQAFSDAVNQLGALAIENCPLGNAPLPGGPGPGKSGK